MVFPPWSRKKVFLGKCLKIAQHALQLQFCKSEKVIYYVCNNLQSFLGFRKRGDVLMFVLVLEVGHKMF